MTSADTTLHSMTGFGRGQRPYALGVVAVEMRAVNHKGLDVKLRLPRDLQPAEPDVQKRLQARMARGRVDVSVQVQRAETAKPRLQLDEENAAALVDNLRSFADAHGIQADVRAADLLPISHLWHLQEEEHDEGELTTAMLGAVDDALDMFCAARATEGAALHQVLLAHVDVIASLSERIESLGKQAPQSLHDKLQARVQKLDVNIDAQRLAQEVALLAEKVDTTEETDRLRMHIDHARKLLAQGSPTGRKLDFLCQEFLREANTCGSKCQDAEVAHLVVDLKAEVERLREQVQNVE